MDRVARHVVAQRWPDVIAPFEALVPSGLSLRALEDDWHGPPGALRTRSLTWLPGPEAPDEEDLLAEVDLDAIRFGWTRLEDESEGAVYELEGVLFRPRWSAPGPDDPTGLILSFAQPWPDACGAPVETSTSFRGLVQEGLGLTEEPLRLTARAVYALVADRTTIDAALHAPTALRVDEGADLAASGALAETLQNLGFEPPRRPGKPWFSETIADGQRVLSSAVRRGETVRVTMRTEPVFD